MFACLLFLFVSYLFMCLHTRVCLFVVCMSVWLVVGVSAHARTDVFVVVCLFV